jgi:hypothetical protein
MSESGRERRENMYKRILTSLTVPFVLALAVATDTATARQHQEIGARAVPSSTQTEVVPKPIPAPTTTVVASSSDGFDWNDAGIGAAFVSGAVLLGAASLVTIRRHHGPVAHN